MTRTKAVLGLVGIVVVGLPLFAAGKTAEMKYIQRDTRSFSKLFIRNLAYAYAIMGAFTAMMLVMND